MNRATLPTTAQSLPRSFRRLFSILAIAPVLAFAACGGGSDGGGAAPPPNNPGGGGGVGAAAQFAYVGNYFGSNVQPFTADGNGNLTMVGNQVATGTHPHNTNVDKAGRFVYIANHDSSFMSGFKINADASLTPINAATPGSPVTNLQGADPTDNNPHWSAFDTTGQFLYSINGVPPALSTLKSYKINADGTLTQIGTTGPLAQCSHGHNVTISPNNSFLYVGCEDSGVVYSFSRDAGSGVVTNLGATVAGGTAPSVVVDPASKFLFVGTTNTVTVFSINGNGTITPILGGQNVFQAQSTPHNVTLDPTGKFLYAANINASTVSAFSVDPNTGALTNLANSPFATGTTPNEVVVHPDGKVLFTADQDSDTVTRFNVNADGTLVRNGNAATFAAGNGTNSMGMTKF